MEHFHYVHRTHLMLVHRVHHDHAGILIRTPLRCQVKTATLFHCRSWSRTDHCPARARCYSSTFVDLVSSRSHSGASPALGRRRSRSRGAARRHAARLCRGARRRSRGGVCYRRPISPLVLPAPGLISSSTSRGK